MTTRLKLILIGIFLIAVSWFVCTQRNLKQEKMVEAKQAKWNSENASEPSQQKSTSQNATTLPSSRVVAPSLHNLKDKGMQTRDVLSSLNDVPIVFYGKLEDQFHDPVSNADITGSILVDNGVSSSVKEIKITSDATGLFHINDGKGESLSVTPRKAGYVMASTNAAFKYSHFYPAVRHIPDPSKPTVIRMWKLQGAEELISINSRFKFVYTKPLFFNIKNGKMLDSGGDIRITINRAEGHLSKRTPADWDLTIEAVEGGLIEVNNAEFRMTFQAPETGYTDNITIRMDAKSRGWFDNVKKILFIKSRNGGVYSKLHFSFRLNERPGEPVTIEFQGLANPHGSRNWEEDTSKIKKVE